MRRIHSSGVDLYPEAEEKGIISVLTKNRECTFKTMPLVSRGLFAQPRPTLGPLRNVDRAGRSISVSHCQYRAFTLVGQTQTSSRGSTKLALLLCIVGHFSFTAVTAAPASYTAIRDTMYGADGIPFSGAIEITRQGTLVDTNKHPATVYTVKNGVINITVPTDRDVPALYHVVYRNDTHVYDEHWSVPHSDTALRLSDVRVQANQLAQIGTTSADISRSRDLTGSTPISDILGLRQELNIRPEIGPGYSAGRIALIATDGTLDGAVGSLSDCIRIDGTSVPCSGYYPNAEVPSGTIDGVNTVFSLSAAPVSKSLALFQNGIILVPAQDYTFANTIITFQSGTVPRPGDTLLAYYQTAGPLGTARGSTDQMLQTRQAPAASFVRMPRVAPNSSRDTCVPGAWALDDTFYYLCVGPSSWRRTPLSSWLNSW